MKVYLDNKVAMFKTSTKLRIVRFMYLFTDFFYKFFNKSLQNKIIKRDNINWKIDLNEAVDYCLYISGTYEPDLVNVYSSIIDQKKMTILDIGANIGPHSLIMANKLKVNSKVYAIEPTTFAYQKLCTNISLNPHLKDKVIARNILLTNPQKKVAIDKVSSSWDISRKIEDAERNPLDGGFYKSIENAKKLSVDQFIKEEKIENLDLIKLDVDGNEIDVLRGAKETFKEMQPILLVELSPIHFDNHIYDFSDLVKELISINYNFFDIEGKKLELDSKKLEKWIPHGTLVNVIGYPKELSSN